MNLPPFMEISSSILQENMLSVRFNSETLFSFPVLAMRGDTLVDAMFLYRSAAGLAGDRPFAWVLLHSLTGEALLLSDCAVHDFMDTARYPLDEPVELTRPRVLSPKEHTKSFQELYEAYEQLRLFAFDPKPDAQQRDAMERYKSLFLCMAFTGHYPYYRALSPEFFGWLGLLPPDNADVPETVPVEAEVTIRQDLLLSIQEQIAALSVLFTEKIAGDTKKNELFDLMHAELTDYKNGLVNAVTEPLERDIIKIIDDVGKSVDACRGKAPSRENYMRFFKLFEGVQTDLVDLLYRQGVEPYSVNGNKVEILRQQILSTVPTDSRELDKTVAQRLSSGWEKGGKVIRPERITAYVHTKGQPPSRE